MKLSQLNVAVRDSIEAPKFSVKLFDDDTEGFTLVLQKTPLLANLKARFVERTAETGLYIREDGFIMKEANRVEDL